MCIPHGIRRQTGAFYMLVGGRFNHVAFVPNGGVCDGQSVAGTTVASLPVPSRDYRYDFAVA
jgi:hypothetical protein